VCVYYLRVVVLDGASEGDLVAPGSETESVLPVLHGSGVVAGSRSSGKPEWWSAAAVRGRRPLLLRVEAGLVATWRQ
jgi:hypothetical protein